MLSQRGKYVLVLVVVVCLVYKKGPPFKTNPGSTLLVISTAIAN